MIFKAALPGRNGLLPFIGTVLLVLLGMALGQLPLTLIADQQGIDLQHVDFNESSLGSNLGFLLLLLGFVGGLIGLICALKWFHARRWRSLITGSNQIDWSRFFSSFVIWFLLVAIAELIMFAAHPTTYQMQFSWRLFLPLLLISLLVLPLQTSWEELFFRGYLMQQLGLLFNHRWVAVLLTSILFGCMHLANPEVEKFGLEMMMFYYISFGLLLAVCTVLDGRLEIALGMHAANNFFGAAIVSFSGSALQTPSLFYQSELRMEYMLPCYLAAALLFFFFFKRKYSWSFKTFSQQIRSTLDETS